MTKDTQEEWEKELLSIFRTLGSHRHDELPEGASHETDGCLYCAVVNFTKKELAQAKQEGKAEGIREENKRIRKSLLHIGGINEVSFFCNGSDFNNVFEKGTP